jgi:hypothetical protein
MTDEQVAKAKARLDEARKPPYAVNANLIYDDIPLLLADRERLRNALMKIQVLTAIPGPPYRLLTVEEGHVNDIARRALGGD